MSNNGNKASYHKVGAVLKKTGDKKGVFVVLGNQNAKDERYKTSVEIIVRDSKGNVTANVKDGFLTVLDPRKKPGITEEQSAKISDRLVSELFIVENPKE